MMSAIYVAGMILMGYCYLKFGYMLIKSISDELKNEA